MTVKAKVAQGFKALDTTVPEAGVYDAQTPLDDLTADIESARDLAYVAEVATHRNISWGAAYQAVMVIPWMKPNERHPEWEHGFQWHCNSPIPMLRSDGLAMEDFVTPTFQTPTRVVDWELSSTDKFGIPRMPEWYSLVTGETPGGEKVAILANWTFSPADDPSKVIPFHRITALLKVNMPSRDWLNEYGKVSGSISSTVEEFTEAKEEARETKRQEFESAKALATEAARQF